jgi:lipoate-protein ligase A
MISTIQLKTGFESAQENMALDQQVFQTQKKDPTKRWFRVYPWQKPGITYPKTRDIPSDFHLLDCAKRETGGGIVFHCPGDIVFSCVAQLTDPYFPKKLKEKLAHFATIFETSLATLDNHTTRETLSVTPKDITFCKTYLNPYELFIDGHKTVAFSLKKTRDWFLVQGIVHVVPTADHFSHLPKKYHPYFTIGLNNTIKPQALIDAIYTAFLSFDKAPSSSSDLFISADK